MLKKKGGVSRHLVQFEHILTECIDAWIDEKVTENWTNECVNGTDFRVYMEKYILNLYKQFGVYWGKEW